ncbi:uncharacterized protein CLUP02_10541 [Colletotrichum lupini]|uniref:Uncharacterized protein n=1 Tax=Colletotrichum lupini TaxID=145971 RepID=A0A9Q8SXQ4_9PEZI|nr:uncharacterized protein CLUP02_10541 [Colletotrichum lupini]UQC85045.1 hypothetical protein CLUP02_10541 [Colletotrichum lupini]
MAEHTRALPHEPKNQLFSDDTTTFFLFHLPHGDMDPLDFMSGLEEREATTFSLLYVSHNGEHFMNSHGINPLPTHPVNHLIPDSNHGSHARTRPVQNLSGSGNTGAPRSFRPAHQRNLHSRCHHIHFFTFHTATQRTATPAQFGPTLGYHVSLTARKEVSRGLSVVCHTEGPGFDSQIVHLFAPLGPGGRKDYASLVVFAVLVVFRSRTMFLATKMGIMLCGWLYDFFCFKSVLSPQHWTTSTMLSPIRTYGALDFALLSQSLPHRPMKKRLNEVGGLPALIFSPIINQEPFVLAIRSPIC